jgi:hypothetical protein
MKWILFTGTWRLTSDEVERDVRNAVREVISNGNGIVTGGALGVDLFALEESLSLGSYTSVRVILPSKLEVYLAHFWSAVESGKIESSDFVRLENSLRELHLKNPSALLEMKAKSINQDEYNNRNSMEVLFSQEVYAFQVNDSTGTQDTIDKAETAGLTISLHKKYTI